MIHLYADENHVIEAVKKVQGLDVSHDNRACIDVYDSEAVMRGITREEAKERNLYGHFGESLCSVQTDGTRWTLKFHETHVEEAFTLRPAGPNAIDAKQAPNPDEIAPELKTVVETMEAAFDVFSWDFTEVSAASIAKPGHFTDFEFEYVMTSTQL